MITFLIGHRGAGKTSLLERLKNYFPQAHCVCLDSEIEKSHGPIATIFSRQGETEFRRIENEVFDQIVSRPTERMFVAVGGGYEGRFPSGSDIVWVQRSLDLSRFLFLNRPSLDPRSHKIQMPKERFQKRTLRYRALATREWLLPEGEYAYLEAEKNFFGAQLKNIGGILTVMPYQLESVDFERWGRERESWGIDFWELRDDLLSDEQIRSAFATLKSDKILMSFRDERRLEKTSQWASKAARCDWPIEWGEVPSALAGKAIVSSHSSVVQFEETLALLQNLKGQIKWSPEIHDFSQLARAHAWQVAEPGRSLLPRSDNGRWQWYRLYQKSRQPLNFFREGTGSATDQPPLALWAEKNPQARFHAAILGQPVSHSWTPMTQKDFFKKRNADILAVDISETEIRENFDFLKQLGFKAFAVTSPLKLWAGDLVGSDKAVNTLAVSSSGVYGASTDEDGFAALLKEAELSSILEPVVVWGGGGVLRMIQKQLPQSVPYSARWGRRRDGSEFRDAPEVLIWAAGSADLAPLLRHNWHPRYVVDLSYRGDSPAIGYAHAVNAKYFSGRTMFYKQAEYQQKFWSSHEWF